MDSPYTDETMRQTAMWASWLSNDWKAEYPLQIHTSGLGADGAPAYHPDFMRWLTRSNGRGKRNEEQRLRTTKVMRRLRRIAPRQFEVCYRVFILGERVVDTTHWLNDRARRNNIPFPEHRPDGPHYSQKDTFALLVASVSFVKVYW